MAEYPDAIEVPIRLRDGLDVRDGADLNAITGVIKRIQTTLGRGIVSRNTGFPGEDSLTLAKAVNASTGLHLMRVEVELAKPGTLVALSYGASEKLWEYNYDYIFLPNLIPIMGTTTLTNPRFIVQPVLSAWESQGDDPYYYPDGSGNSIMGEWWLEEVNHSTGASVGYTNAATWVLGSTITQGAIGRTDGDLPDNTPYIKLGWYWFRDCAVDGDDTTNSMMFQIICITDPYEAA